jgi:hypothetical protein
MPGSPTDPGATETVACRVADYLWFVDVALNEMRRIVGELGDELANRRPALEGANSAYAIVTHCLGVLEYWGGATIADRTITRDRASEFVAEGPIDELLERVEGARRQLRLDVQGVDGAAPPSHIVVKADDPVPYRERRGAVLLHVIEELFQHLGQMEITADVLRSAGGLRD